MSARTTGGEDQPGGFFHPFWPLKKGKGILWEGPEHRDYRIGPGFLRLRLVRPFGCAHFGELTASRATLRSPHRGEQGSL